LVPIIGITFPEPVTSAEVTAFLEACDQAFLEGDCARASSGTTFELSARVVWESETRASIIVARSEDGASDSEEVSFVENDEGVERYRALGFTVGSLSSAFVAVPEEVLPAPPLPEPLAVPEPEVRDQVDPPDPLPEAEDTPTRPLDEVLTRAAVEAGFQGANGIQNPRFGGEVALWVPAYGRWASRWSFAYSIQPETEDGVGAGFLEGNALVGPRFTIDRALVAALVGIQAQRPVFTLGEAELARNGVAVGPALALHARLDDSLLAPFLLARASYISRTPVRVEEIDEAGRPIPESTRDLGTHGPWQLEILAGVSTSFSP
jgi:hypothetical protein